MPSIALGHWQRSRVGDLDEIEAAHLAIGGTGPGRRHSTQQINQAYVVLLSSQFQAFCRELHNECIGWFIRDISPEVRRDALYNSLKENRKLDRGNPNSGNIGADYSRFKISFWEEVHKLDSRNKGRQGRLNTLNQWRNAIAHQDFSATELAGTMIRLEKAREAEREDDDDMSRLDCFRNEKGLA